MNNLGYDSSCTCSVRDHPDLTQFSLQTLKSFQSNPDLAVLFLLSYHMPGIGPVRVTATLQTIARRITRGSKGNYCRDRCTDTKAAAGARIALRARSHQLQWTRPAQGKQQKLRWWQKAQAQPGRAQAHSGSVEASLGGAA